jgi:DNA-binding transcriptional regulator YhcF (GntR family)
MKKTLWILPLLLLLSVSIATAGDEKVDVKAMKQKLAQKIETMKANGASQEEIDKMVADFKKKVAAMEADHKTSTKVDALKIEAKKKIAEMKAAGASEQEIQDVIAKYKQKIQQLEAKSVKKEKSKKKEKPTK